ncbi:chorismate mutase [Frankia sp. CNm7]|uniref:Chorismate mutase n=1 Tax=Frankia nepalensis TaxID=1836974 RepID=A0A937UNY6_9ACTN|nr:chorismate mutase [Frankia nepalensis]MBL7501368.1 chorismate mutase [Frankia nepalensis]MBL7514813.1 chorismate mutase [Frankia nepalensis]MBL7517811.1 chorismate mutase [Frankia nepalensis]MBL7628502.1 chorismate mutase [Frankia nepalensis]
MDAGLDSSLAPAPATPAAPTIASIDEGRRLIDDIDVQLRALVAVRRDISRQIQTLRTGEGGPRVQHGRENEIIAAWADDLGPRGVEIALAVLTLCRGSLT